SCGSSVIGTLCVSPFPCAAGATSERPTRSSSPTGTQPRPLHSGHLIALSRFVREPVRTTPLPSQASQRRAYFVCIVACAGTSPTETSTASRTSALAGFIAGGQIRPRNGAAQRGHG